MMPPHSDREKCRVPASRADPAAAVGTTASGVQQPALQQFGGPSIEFVGASFDVGEHVDDSGQVVKVAAAAVPGRCRVHRSVDL